MCTLYDIKHAIMEGMSLCKILHKLEGFKIIDCFNF